MMVQIRRGNDADIDDLLVIEDECFSIYYYGQYKFGPDEFLYYLHGPNSILQVASPNGHIVGYSAAVVRRPRTGALLHIDSIGVLPDHRNRGIGHQLLQTLIDEARHRHCRIVVLEVATPNEAGIAFFKSHGFHQVRKLPNYYGQALDGILMTADL
jgi:ribosomal protein S18 acetylase RimI-like enzyme